MALLDITNVSRMLELYLGHKSCLTLCVFDTHSPHIPRNRDPAFVEQSTTHIGSKIFVAIYAESVVAEPICTAHARDVSVHIAWVYSVQM